MRRPTITLIAMKPPASNPLHPTANPKILFSPFLSSLLWRCRIVDPWRSAAVIVATAAFALLCGCSANTTFVVAVLHAATVVVAFGATMPWLMLPTPVAAVAASDVQNLPFLFLFFEFWPKKKIFFLSKTNFWK